MVTPARKGKKGEGVGEGKVIGEFCPSATRNSGVSAGAYASVN